MEPPAHAPAAVPPPPAPPFQSLLVASTAHANAIHNRPLPSAFPRGTNPLSRGGGGGAVHRGAVALGDPGQWGALGGSVRPSPPLELLFGGGGACGAGHPGLTHTDTQRRRLWTA